MCLCFCVICVLLVVLLGADNRLFVYCCCLFVLSVSCFACFIACFGVLADVVPPLFSSAFFTHVHSPRVMWGSVF